MYDGSARTKWHDDDDPMVRLISGKLRKDFREGDVVLAPLGIGNHVDHLITRHVAETSNPPSLLYYSEVPYVVTFSEQLPKKTERLCAVEYSLKPSEVDDWIGAVRCYVTQMRMLEKAVGDVPQLVHRYATANGLRLYRSCSAPPPDLAAFSFFHSSVTADA
jgi:hypothetical protein